MVERLLKGEPEDLTEEEKNQQYTVSAVDSVLNKVCENCGEYGHKIWECTSSFLQKKPTVQCQICGEKSHPTLDCPQKKSLSKLTINQQHRVTTSRRTRSS